MVWWEHHSLYPIHGYCMAPKDQDYSFRMPAASTNLYLVGVTYAVEVYKNGPFHVNVVKTRYQKDCSPAQKEELARLHETMHILPVFNQIFTVLSEPFQRKVFRIQGTTT